MKSPRFLMLALLPVVAAFGLLAGPAAAPAHADLDDFTFDSYHADFTLGVEADGRSKLHTTETFVAQFPDVDQNRGFIRAIPQVYNGFSLEIANLSVTDEHGDPRPFWVEDAGDSLDVVMAVPEGSYVRGEQTYVLDYSQNDVTAYFEDTDADEFYWDLNGTDSRQPYGTVSATLTLENGLEMQLTGDSACYRGGLGSADPCSITQTGNVFTVSEQDLGPGENVSIAIGFQPHTFAPAPEEHRIAEPATSDPFTATPNPLRTLFGGLPVFLWGSIASVIGAISVFITSRIRGRRRTGRAIIAQYDPPPGVSVALAAEVSGTPKKAMTATLLDFAVRRKIRLLHSETSDRYGAEALNSEELLSIEKQVYAGIFPKNGVPGTIVWFDKKSTRLGNAAARLPQQARTEGRKSGYFGKRSAWAAGGIVLLVLAAFGLLALHAYAHWGFGALIVILVGGGNLLIWGFVGFVAIFSGGRPPLTHEGALLRDHLLGLEEFIRLAEADRIRMLQSASGAEVDSQHVVQLYERLLPYAVIFNQEVEWQQELAKYYRDVTPDWVQGEPNFSQAMMLSHFHHSIRSSPVTKTASSSSGFSSGGSFSSSRGGSSGGGFSGGGGGGGGTRGI